ncbi:D-alanyl-D-alanine carboxypeptidase [Vibrio renipiscarius]|uniref:D-alanyl-D-alanine carboxypeptidase n=2 Tax=Vibrio renipiscarius TaxID=1461322 RepID=A0A0C2NU00_9VIBR|nr:serine-type D-Ala-D-Ala carboxypeptidase [Vibrio renipiscarius]KII77627.1 D-alanyl-D-alanine carboxypeptidase [Vibrio renipiscarius]KII81432.1 D-alanyl-D-alanine carboxypeptidase [Vibrio renipiscarius]
MTPLFRSAVTSIICLSSSFAFAYAPIEHLPQGSRVSIAIEPLNGKKPFLTTSNRDQFFPPASTLKVVTALAAKLALGDEFQFKTRLESNQHDVVIRFSGDPTLTRQDLKQLLTLARQQGITTIKGDLWLDNSAFNGYERAIGWPWDITGVCYSAPSSAITLDENCVQASIYANKDGSTRAYTPEHFPIYLSTTAKTISKQRYEETHCDLELLTTPENHYQLSGCLVERSKPLPLKFAVQNPTLYTQRTVHALLNQLNIKLVGDVRVGTPEISNLKPIATHYSAKLPELLTVMLQKSDNLIADNVTKAIGQHHFNLPGSYNTGTEAIKQVIGEKTGINIERNTIVDGSGLSRNNRFTSADMTALLRYIWQHDEQLGLIALMPTAGKNGTLKYRSSMRNEPIKGQLVAKSGSVYGSYNMAGFGLNKQGQATTLFVQYVADYLPTKKDNDTPTVAPITQFEQQFYEDVLKYSQASPRK